MRTLQITVQRRWKDRWPVVAEWPEPGSGLIIRRDSYLATAKSASAESLRLLTGRQLGMALFHGAVREALGQARGDLRALIVAPCPLDPGGKWGLLPFDVGAAVAAARQSLVGKVPCEVFASTNDATGPPTLNAVLTRLTDSPPCTLLHWVGHGRY